MQVQIPQPSAELLSAVRSLKSWKFAEPLPEGLPDMEAVRAESSRILEPGGPKVAILLDRLFSVLPVPTEESMPEWVRLIGEFPLWAVAEGVESLIRSFRYGRPPLPADLINAIEAGETYRRRRAMHDRFGSALLRAKLDAKDPPALSAPTRDVRPAIEALGQALAKPVRDPADISADEFQRRRAEVLAECERAGMGGA